MSKAFTRESDGEADERAALRAPRAPRPARPITAVGAERLRSELNSLVQERAKRSGTTSQPGEAATQRSLDLRLRELEQVLSEVVVSELPRERERDRIAFGAKVTVQQADGQRATYRIVGVDETDVDRGDISWLSPLAQALRTKRVGETVHFHTPAGEETLEILKIEF